VLVDVLLDDGAAALLLALEHHAEVDRQPAGPLQPALRRQQERERRPLVVGAAAGAHLAVDDRRLERRRLPQLQRLGRLHVVVAVDQQRGPVVAGGRGVAVDRGQPAALEQAGLEPGVLQAGAKERRGPARVLVTVALGAHRRDAQEGEELVEKGLVMGLEVAKRLLHEAPG
jgi:hypothetical protein